jgi:hypothetical protein
MHIQYYSRNTNNETLIKVQKDIKHHAQQHQQTVLEVDTGMTQKFTSSSVGCWNEIEEHSCNN